MKTMKIWRLALAMLAAFSLASCSLDDDDDNDKDIVNEMNMSVSAEPGVMYDLFDSLREHPIECMRVKRTILANPPQDASNRTYELVRILSDKKV